MWRRIPGTILVWEFLHRGWQQHWPHQQWIFLLSKQCFSQISVFFLINLWLICSRLPLHCFDIRMQRMEDDLRLADRTRHPILLFAPTQTVNSSQRYLHDFVKTFTIFSVKIGCIYLNTYLNKPCLSPLKQSTMANMDLYNFCPKYWEAADYITWAKLAVDRKWQEAAKTLEEQVETWKIKYLRCEQQGACSCLWGEAAVPACM